MFSDSNTENSTPEKWTPLLLAVKLQHTLKLGINQRLYHGKWQRACGKAGKGKRAKKPQKANCCSWRSWAGSVAWVCKLFFFLWPRKNCLVIYLLQADPNCSQGVPENPQNCLFPFPFPLGAPGVEIELQGAGAEPALLRDGMEHRGCCCQGALWNRQWGHKRLPKSCH